VVLLAEGERVVGAPKPVLPSMTVVVGAVEDVPQ